MRAPRANAIAERWIASARRECLDRMLVTGERHLRLVLSEYVDHYNSHRPHRSLHQSPPAGRLHPPAPGAKVRVLRRDLLGGLIHEYSQVARGDRISGTHTFRPCLRCNDTGRNSGSTGKRFGECRRCKGTGRRRRVFARTLHRGAVSIAEKARTRKSGK